jgi:hypothetical protein
MPGFPQSRSRTGQAAFHPYQSLSGPTSTAGSGRQRPSVRAEAAVDQTTLASDRRIAGAPILPQRTGIVR